MDLVATAKNTKAKTSYPNELVHHPDLSLFAVFNNIIVFLMHNPQLKV